MAIFLGAGGWVERRDESEEWEVRVSEEGEGRLRAMAVEETRKSSEVECI